MVRFVLFFTVLAVLLALIFGGAVMVVLGASGTLYPDHALFPFQLAGEQTLYNLPGSRLTRANRALDFADRRLENLSTLTGTDAELVAAVFFTSSLNQAVQAASKVRPAESTELLTRLGYFSTVVDAVVKRLQIIPELYPDTDRALEDKLGTLNLLLQELTTRQVDLNRAAVLDVPFPPELLSAVNLSNFLMGNPITEDEHAQFSLIGRHAILECTSCHTTALRTGTPTQCEDCHATTLPPDHYTGECRACHSTVFWQAVHFEHSLVDSADCGSCHPTAKPENHFEAQ